MKRHTVSTFKPHQEGLSTIFGTLEADIMELVWGSDEIAGRDVYEALRDQGQRLSYGAVRTVLDRLVKKHVLARRMETNQYIYRATRSRQDFANSAVGEILDSLLSSFGEPVLAQFLSRVEASDPQRLNELARLIDAAEQRRATQDDA